MVQGERYRKRTGIKTFIGIFFRSLFIKEVVINSDMKVDWPDWSPLKQVPCGGMWDELSFPQCIKTPFQGPWRQVSDNMMIKGFNQRELCKKGEKKSLINHFRKYM